MDKDVIKAIFNPIGPCSSSKSAYYWHFTIKLLINKILITDPFTKVVLFSSECTVQMNRLYSVK